MLHSKKRARRSSPDCGAVDDVGGPRGGGLTGPHLLQGAKVAALVWAADNQGGTILVGEEDALYQKLGDAECGALQLPCNLVHAGMFRNGRGRQFCTIHQQHYGYGKDNPSGRCRSSDRLMRFTKSPLRIDLRELGAAAEVGLWAACPPGLDTTNRPGLIGIHVHLRERPGVPKHVDATYRAVELTTLEGRVVYITPPSAIALLAAKVNGLESLMGLLACTRCGTQHEDVANGFWDKPHHKHLCLGCGRDVCSPRNEPPIISNPLFPALGGRAHDAQAGDAPPLVLSSLQHDVQLFASTPALLWQADRPEALGIHVHAYNKVTGVREVDESYAQVQLDGKAVDRQALLRAMLRAAQEDAQPNAALDGLLMQEDD